MTTLGIKYDVLKREIEELKPKTYIEIGVYKLETFSAVKEDFDIPEMYGFDLFEQADKHEVAPEDGPPPTYKEAKKRVPGTTLFAGDTKETLPNIALIEFPTPILAFVDGGHSYETVKSDIDVLLEELPTGSVIIIDDGPMSGVKKALETYDDVIDLELGVKKIVVS